MFGHENIFAEATAFGFFILLAILIASAPLLFFVSKLHHLKQQGLNQYSALATSYTQAFHARWITHEAPADESLLGTGDIQSLADLANSFEVIKKMNVLPVTKENLISLVAPILLPIIPLTATVVPLDEIFKVLLRVVT
jgi:hypothetical protein